MGESQENERKKTIVLFGVSGFIGSNLANFLSSDYKVVGTYYKNRVSLSNVLTLPCNVVNKEEVQLILFTFKPDIAIYCVGIPSVYECSKNENLADALNSVGLFNVTEYCQRYQVQICYLSSAQVFKGEKRNYIEMDSPDANTVYGKTQTAAEFYIQKMGINYIIFRSCKLYGRSINPFNATWLEKIQRKFIRKENVMCDDYIHMGFLDIYYLTMILRMCFKKKIANRLFQISTADTCTHYEFANRYCQIFQESKSSLSKGGWPFPLLDETIRPDDKKLYFKLDLSNIEGFLGIKMPTIEESLQFTKMRFNGDLWPSRGRKSTSGTAFI